MLNFSCPNCGAQYEVNDNLAGEKVACCVCDHRFFIEKTETASDTAAAVDAETFSAEPAVDNELPPLDVAYNQGPATYITCPHCWQHFDLREIKYVSRHLELIGDPVLGPDAWKRFTPMKYSAKGMAIDEKGMECPEMACPKCHLSIPEAVVDLPSSIFSIVGAPASGKSYFLATMLHQARKTLPSYFEFNLSDVDSSVNMVLNGYESLLFMNNHPEKPVALPKTELQGAAYTNQILMNGFSVDLPKPFIFALTPKQGHQSYGKEEKTLQRNIILYDNAGEHFQPGYESVNNLATNHLAYSDGIIFIYDPLRDSRMQKYCDSNDPQFQQESVNQLSLFYEMAARVRKFSGISSTEKYHQPMIVAIAKFDVLQERFGLSLKNEDFISYDSETMEYSINMQNVTDTSFRLRQKLLEIAPELVSAAEEFSTSVYFVPVSAFGCSPAYLDGSSTLGIVPAAMRPLWIDVPLLLQFHLHGLIAGSYPDVAGAIPIERFKTTSETIMFSFPGEEKRIELPRFYCGTSIYCKEQDKFYSLPLIEGAARHQSFQATTLDEQIDNEFWNN